MNATSKRERWKPSTRLGVSGETPSMPKAPRPYAVVRRARSGQRRASPREEARDAAAASEAVLGGLARVAGDEVLHALPGIGGRVGELRLLAVEEAMGRARIHRGLVRHVGLLQGVIEGFDVRRWDALVGAAEE